MAAKDATPRVDPLLAMQVRLASASTLWKRTRRATDPPTPRIPSSSPPTLAQADPKLAPFLRDDFDGTAYASGVLAGGPDAPKDAKTKRNKRKAIVVSGTWAYLLKRMMGGG